MTGNNAGSIDASDNTAAHNAHCAGNTPPPTEDGLEDGPNSAGHSNTRG